MQTTLTQDLTLLLDHKIDELILNELQLLHQYQLADHLSLASQILDNINMGVLLGEHQLVAVFRLLYRVRNGSEGRAKDISCNKLFKWMGKDTVREVLMNRVVQVIRKQGIVMKGMKYEEHEGKAES